MLSSMEFQIDELLHFDNFFWTLCIIMLIDLVLGTIISWLGYDYTSRKWINGFVRKIGYLAIILAVDVISSSVMADGAVFRTGITMGFIFYEFSSILEHTVVLGVQFPKALTDFIEHLSVSSGEKDRKNLEDKEEKDQENSDI